MGLSVDNYRGLRIVEHSGATAGYYADLLRFPGHEFAVAVLCNAAPVPAVQYAMQLVDSLMGPRWSRRIEKPAPGLGHGDGDTSGGPGRLRGHYYSPDAETTLEVSDTNSAFTFFRRPVDAHPAA